VLRFERRGLSFRDAFDSSFDDVVPVGYLDAQTGDRAPRAPHHRSPCAVRAVVPLHGGRAAARPHPSRTRCRQPRTDDGRAGTLRNLRDGRGRGHRDQGESLADRVARSHRDRPGICSSAGSTTLPRADGRRTTSRSGSPPPTARHPGARAAARVSPGAATPPSLPKSSGSPGSSPRSGWSH
jgi:hypothetical protein